MNKLVDKVRGYKTYIVAVTGIVVGLVGHFFGPMHIGDIEIPQLSWSQVWGIIWHGGLFSFLRMGVKKVPVIPA